MLKLINVFKRSTNEACFGASMWITNSLKKSVSHYKGRGGSDSTVSDPIVYSLLLAEGSG